MWEPRLLACSKHVLTETEEIYERQQSCISSGAGLEELTHFFQLVALL